MRVKLPKAFDESLARINKGESVKTCLAEYPHLRQQLVPLLYSGLFIPAIPKASPSDDFRRISKARLMARLCERSIETEKSHQARPASNGLGIIWRGLERAFIGPARVAVPLTLVLILALQCLFLFGTLSSVSLSPASTLTSHCTLSTLTGAVQLQTPGSSTWEEAENGMTLAAGSRVRTAPDSQALLTFFNGTTVKLESGTNLVVEQVERGGENQPTVIVLRQWLGKTWSRVTKLTDPGSHYEIQTPSASALVRGTLFSTEVDETGATTVQTIEGLVGVNAQGEEVYLSAGRQTTVSPGAPPSEPVPVSSSEGEQLTQSPDNEGPPAQGHDKLPVPGQDGSQDDAIIVGEGQSSEQDIDNMWWVVLGAILFSTTMTVFIWRR